MVCISVGVFAYVFLISKKIIIRKCWLKNSASNNENVASEIARGRHQQHPSNISDVELGQNIGVL